jgi:hypothetical protein
MADDADEERFRRHEEWLNSFALIHQRQDAMNQEQRAINERLTTAIERIETTLARLETLMTRVLREQPGNGRDA